MKPSKLLFAGATVVGLHAMPVFGRNVEKEDVAAKTYISETTRIKKGDTCCIALDLSAGAISVEARGAVTSNPIRGKASWEMRFMDRNGKPTCRGVVSWGQTGFDDAYDSRYLRLTTDTADVSGKWHKVAEFDFFENVDLHKGANSLVADVQDGIAKFYVGSRLVSFGGEAPMKCRPSSVCICSDRDLKLEYVAVKEYADVAARLHTEWDEKKLHERFTVTTDKIEGLWTFLDRDNDPLWARPGGFYTLALVSTPDGGYDVLYVDGAKTNSSSWHPYMIKGHLKPTIFQNHYTLQWYDAEFNDAGPECSADLQGDGIMVFNFPLHHAWFRYSRVKIER